MSRAVKCKATQLKCPQCGNIASIMRKESSLRKVGHLKKLYCFICKEEVNHIELHDASLYDINEDYDLTPINKKQDKIRVIKRIKLEDVE